MYNKTKRAFDVTAAVLSIVGGGLVALSCLIEFGALRSYTYLYNVSLAVVVAVILVMLAIAIAIIVIGSMLCKKPTKVNDVYPKNLGLNITLITLLALFTVLFLLSIDGILYFFIFGTALGFKITTLCLRSEVPDPPVVEQPAEPQVAVEVAPAQIPTEIPAPAPTLTVEEKIAELKRLKELGVLDDEQYAKAIEKIIHDLQ